MTIKTIARGAFALIATSLTLPAIAMLLAVKFALVLLALMALLAVVRVYLGG